MQKYKHARIDGVFLEEEKQSVNRIKVSFSEEALKRFKTNTNQKTGVVYHHFFIQRTKPFGEKGRYTHWAFEKVPCTNEEKAVSILSHLTEEETMALKAQLENI